jgi:hypothetical protein
VKLQKLGDPNQVALKLERDGVGISRYRLQDLLVVELHCKYNCYIGKFEDHILGLNRIYGQELIKQSCLKTVEICGCNKRLSKDVTMLIELN